MPPPPQVPDARYDFLCSMWEPPSKYPAYLQIVDIAGLVKVGGASDEATWLGKSFTDLFAHRPGFMF